jgi:hypothetical protein
MKTVEVVRQFDYTPPSDRRVMFRFFAGVVYERVIDAAALGIERAGAGRIVTGSAPGLKSVDAKHAFRKRR